MADSLLLLYGQPQCAWCVVNDKKQITSEILVGSLQQAAAFHNKQKIIVVLDGLQCSYFHIKLPKSNRRKAIAAIPYQLEEELSEDIEKLKFNYQLKSKTDNLGVVVINQQTIAQISADLEKHQLSATAICPAFALLTPKTLNRYNGINTCHVDDELQFTCRDNLLPLMLSASKVKEEDLTVNQHPILNDIAKNIGHIPYNLLDQAKSYTSNKKHLLNWLLPIVLLLGILTSYLVSLHLQTKKINQQADAKHQLSLQILKKAFPEIKKAHNPRALMKSKIKQLGRQNTSQQFALTTLIFNVGNTLSDFSNITITSLNANKNSLEIDIQTPQLSTIDDIKKILSQRDGYKVNVSSISQNKNGATGRLIIKQ